MNDLTPLRSDPGALAAILAAPADPVDITVSKTTADLVSAHHEDLMRAARHEASHACAMRAMGYPPVVSVDIRRRDGGGVTESGLGSLDQEALRSAAKIRKSIVARLAGTLGEVLTSPDHEGSSGGQADLRGASDDALLLVDSGLDPAAPVLSVESFAYSRAPEWLADARARAAEAILVSARAEAAELVARLEPAINSFAASLLSSPRLRLEGEGLEAAFLAAGLPPAEPGVR